MNSFLSHQKWHKKILCTIVSLFFLFSSSITMAEKNIPNNSSKSTARSSQSKKTSSKSSDMPSVSKSWGSCSVNIEKLLPKFSSSIPKLNLIAAIRGPHVNSPKSVAFHPDGSVFYVNSLEGMETLVFDSNTFKCKAIISHRFEKNNAYLFLNGEEDFFHYPYYTKREPGTRNIFGGKPVEMAFSHGGRFLWVPYYRRSYDLNASCPSAVAIIDTKINQIVRVMPTGPIPKMIMPSPDGKTMAVIHWGDNTAALIDISSQDPMKFTYKRHLISGHRLNLKGISTMRDHDCGQCLRGASFSSDSKYLFVCRMSKSPGIAVFDAHSGDLVGVFKNVPNTPRHIELSRNGKYAYITSSQSGTITELETKKVLQAVLNPNNKKFASYHGRELHIGGVPRTCTLSPDEKSLYIACNGSCSLIRINIKKWKVSGWAPAYPFPVGLDVSPNGKLVITTSQGKKGMDGGHVICIFNADN